MSNQQTILKQLQEKITELEKANSLLFSELRSVDQVSENTSSNSQLYKIRHTYTLLCEFRDSFSQLLSVYTGNPRESFINERG